ncbi:MAG TPA: hypothetical protein VIZ67_10875 [Acidimicrobiales bacterium]
MRWHLIGRGWRRATPYTANLRFNHSDRLPIHNLPEASHLSRSLR